MGEYIGVAGGIAGSSSEGGDMEEQLMEWAPYIGVGLVVVAVVVFFATRK